MAYREQPAAISRDKATFTLDTHIAWKQAVSTSSPKWNNALLCLHFLPRDATYKPGLCRHTVSVCQRFYGSVGFTRWQHRAMDSTELRGEICCGRHLHLCKRKCRLTVETEQIVIFYTRCAIAVSFVQR